MMAMVMKARGGEGGESHNAHGQLKRDDALQQRLHFSLKDTKSTITL